MKTKLSLPHYDGEGEPRAVNVNQSHVANARVLGTFSHTTCFPISYALWACFLDRSASGGRGTEKALHEAENFAQRLFMWCSDCATASFYVIIFEEAYAERDADFSLEECQVLWLIVLCNV